MAAGVAFESNITVSNSAGITIFLVEQNVHQTLAIAHHGYALSKGRVVAEGTSQELASRDEVREAYFG